MKNTTIIALAILLLTVPFSCSQSGKKEVKSKIIDVASSVGGGRITDLSEIVSDIKYIPLETSKNSLVGEMVRVNYEKGRIYINDRSDSVKIFDYDGKFLRNFGRRGRGPQEYGFLEIFYVTPQNLELPPEIELQ
jgi:hypothetical protein